MRIATVALLCFLLGNTFVRAQAQDQAPREVAASNLQHSEISASID